MVDLRTLRVGALVACAYVCAAVAPASAQLIQFFGDERVGTSGGQFLRIPVGARGIAMGQGMTATIDGAASVFWNPAGLKNLPRSGRAFISHTEYSADIDLDHVAYAQPFGAWQLGLSLGMLRSGDILRTTEFHPNGTGQTFNANQFVAGLTVGRRLTDRFAFATTVKFLQENLDDFESRGVLLDVGALYNVGYRNARIGFAVRNFGSDLKLNGTPPSGANTNQGWQSFPAPTVAVFGFAYDWVVYGNRKFTTSLDFDHPSDEVERLVFGGELAVGRGLFLRGGYRNKVEGGGGVSTGFGLLLLKKQMPLRFDYAFDDRGRFGGLHTISLEVGR